MKNNYGQIKHEKNTYAFQMHYEMFYYIFIIFDCQRKWKHVKLPPPVN